VDVLHVANVNIVSSDLIAIGALAFVASSALADLEDVARSKKLLAGADESDTMSSFLAQWKRRGYKIGAKTYEARFYRLKAVCLPKSPSGLI
jgi:hypothetical protein